MAKYRSELPQLGGEFFVTDGGIETTLIFLEGQDLPLFAAFHLLKTTEGEQALRKYYGSSPRRTDRSRVPAAFPEVDVTANRPSLDGAGRLEEWMGG